MLARKVRLSEGTGFGEQAGTRLEVDDVPRYLLPAGAARAALVLVRRALRGRHALPKHLGKPRRQRCPPKEALGNQGRSRGGTAFRCGNAVTDLQPAVGAALT